MPYAFFRLLGALMLPPAAQCPQLLKIVSNFSTFATSLYSPHQNLPCQRSRPPKFSSTQANG